MIGKKVKLNLIGLDGNAFSLMGVFQHQARKEGWTSSEIKEVLDKCTSGDYSQLVATLWGYCESENEFVDSDDYYGYDMDDEDDNY